MVFIIQNKKNVMNKQRIDWLDFAKILTMLFVIIGHLGLENRDIGDFIVSFHMPVFFYISGIFNSNKYSWTDFFKKNFYRLLLPVILWHIIGMFTWEPLVTIFFDRSNWLDKYLDSQIAFFSGYSSGFGWFMICLFWLKFIDRVLNKYKFGRYYGIVILPLACYFIHLYIKIPFYVLNAFMAYPFFAMGYYSKDKLLNSLVSFRVKKCCLFVVSTVILVILVYYNRCGSLNAIEYGNYPILLYIQGFVGCIWTVVISMVLYKMLSHNILSTLGNGTIVLLLLQPPFLLICRFFYRAIFSPSHTAPYFDPISALACAIIIMATMYPIIIFINKKFPLLNGMKKTIYKT